MSVYKKSILFFLATLVFVACDNEKDLACEYNYTDSGSGMVVKGRSVICEQCTPKERENAKKLFDATAGYSNVYCEDE